ncbi:hypothetical protein LTR62_007692 [Meristemomyces frigidus]|uniref:Uncharacterized protein n=1 Tax=Meristemomyces frigidus TaxID=1508187 RepID=A0AAN7TBH5_9PEZI|nr:hypothetical protein LTR62_007692 [Meristemomyces frigidus]
MQSARPRKKFGTDLNRYLGVELETPVKALRDRTNLSANYKESPSGAGNDTTFLPELHSTPPVPTFLKSSRKVESTTCSPTSITAMKSTPGSWRARSRSEVLPPHFDGTSRTKGKATTEPPATSNTLLVYRMEDTPPLPAGWLEQHDRAICVLDARNYSLPTIVIKIRRTFPSLRGTLTLAMVDKRLRQLDQIPELDYWRVGLLGSKKSMLAVGSGDGQRVTSGLTVGKGENRLPSKGVETSGKRVTHGIWCERVENAR